MMDKKSCNKDCNGIIKELKVNGLDYPNTITVEYEVNGNVYELKENLVMKKEKNIMLGFIPVGYKTKSLIELRTGIEARIGNKVNVKYDESNPNNAYLIDNEGKVSWN